MKVKKTDIITCLVFAIFLVETGFIIDSLKEGAQLFTILFGGLTFTTLIIKRNTLSTILFYILLGTILLINYGLLTNLIIGVIDPNRGTVMVDGVKRHVMDMTWILGILLGLVFAPITITIYHKKLRSDRVIEIVFTAVFIIVTALIYFNHKSAYAY